MKNPANFQATFTLEITPAWDRRDPDPCKNYGIHCCELFAMLTDGDKGVSFTLFTGWWLKQNRCATSSSHSSYPMAADISWHRLREPDDDNEVCSGSLKCRVIGNRPCVCGGSTLNAEHYKELLISQGSAGLEKAMRKFFNKTFQTNHPIE